jgi:hypothetical protein
MQHKLESESKKNYERLFKRQAGQKEKKIVRHTMEWHGTRGGV